MFEKWRSRRLINIVLHYRQQEHAHKASGVPSDDRIGKLRGKAERAASSIGPTGNRDMVDALIEVLMDTDLYKDVRWEVANSLAQLGDPRAIEPLLRVLKNGHNDLLTRYYANRALQRMGWKPGNDIESAEVEVALDRFAESVKFGAAAVPSLIAEIEFEYGRLRSSLTKNDEREYDVGKCHELGKALGMIRDKRAVPALIVALERKSNWEDPEDCLEPRHLFLLDGVLKYIRKYAAQALGAIGERIALPPLVKALSDNSVEVRLAAANALQNFSDLDLSGSDLAWFYIAKQDVQKCIGLGAPAVGPLIEQLERLDWSAAAALGDIGDSRAIGPLRQASRWTGCTSAFHAEVIRALAKMGDQQLVDEVLKIVARHDDWRYLEYWAAIEAIGVLGIPGGIEPLREIVENKYESHDARVFAGRALAKLLNGHPQDSP
jgi:HEAT repeat protein